MGIGFKCQDGVVLAADTMGNYITEAGKERLGRDDGKVRWLQGSRIATVISGLTNYGDLEQVGVVGTCSVGAGQASTAKENLVTDAFDRIKYVNDEARLRHRGQPSVDGKAKGAPATLFAGGPAGTEPFLARLTRLEETVWARNGDVLAIGCWLELVTPDIAKEMHEAPSTLSACREAAADWLRRMLMAAFGTLSFQESIKSGWVPGVAFPLQVWTFTDTDLVHEVIEA